MKVLRRLAHAYSLLWLALPLAACAGSSSDAVLHEDLPLPYLLHSPPHGNAGAPLIVLMHGMGSDERDLYDLRSAMPARYAVVSARAPFTMSEGHYEWFHGTQVNGRLDGNPSDIAASRALIERFVDQLVKRYGFDSKQVYLIGFSQGAIMSYEVALSDPGLARGIGVMSGAIFDSLVPQLKPSFTLSHLRVFISHGSADETIPVSYAVSADQRLRVLGV
jgi:phospholipase/carboxylesterase